MNNEHNFVDIIINRRQMIACPREYMCKRALGILVIVLGVSLSTGVQPPPPPPSLPSHLKKKTVPMMPKVKAMIRSQRGRKHAMLSSTPGPVSHHLSLSPQKPNQTRPNHRMLLLLLAAVRNNPPVSSITGLIREIEAGS